MALLSKDIERKQWWPAFTHIARKNQNKQKTTTKANKQFSEDFAQIPRIEYPVIT